jgi:para-aminobenzoate synthetase/4-amino-4-deoxychorismate lyase
VTHPIVIHDPEAGHWLTFENPVRIISASSLAEILPALREIETEVNQNGLFAAGFLSYEAAPAFDSALKVRPDDSGFPLLWFGLYHAPQSTLATEAAHPGLHSLGDGGTSWLPTITREEYETTVARLRQYLFTGDTYQVNYTFRLRGPCPASPETLFHNLVQAQGPHYSAFVDTGNFVLCSASPELFFRLEGDRLESRPMKGTEKRGLTPEDDRNQAKRLQDSEKNRAENIMIVDMIRNDMGRIAISGSVVPERLFEIERYPTVWQMVSTVTSQTRAALSDIFTALFPCASITGAPKPRTMDIIAREETTPRRIYTGTIGYLAPGRRAQFNIAIRTVLVDRPAGTAEYGVGGGIVWDSETGNEYEECWLKAKVLTDSPPVFDLLETLLWTPADGIFILARHLHRLAESAEYFDIPLSIPDLRSLLNAEGLMGTVPLRIRLRVARDGKITLESTPLDLRNASSPVRVRLAAKPVDPGDRFLYHKTTHRAVYEQAKAGVEDCDDVLLWNPAGELTESTIANIVVERNGELLTPPVRCGLLPGTYRAELLEQGNIREAILPVSELSPSDKIHLINSVRKWREAILIPTVP